MHLSTGDMLRAAVASGSDVGMAAKEAMEAGQLVPDEVVIGAVKERLAQADCQKRGWLLDGFPRTRAQADALAEAGIEADVFILLDVPDAALVERVVGRRTDPETGKIYHMTYAPPESEEVLARLTQRADDTEEKVVVRLQNYHSNLSAILDAYTDITVRVNGSRGKMEVYADIKRMLCGRQGRPLRIIISGAPASGKGTQCESIREEFGVVHLSTGDMLRAAVASGSDVGMAAKEAMEAGQLVPDEVVIGAVKERLAQADCQKRGWLLDGFPRTRAQADALAEAGIEADVFILLDVPDAALVERVVGRRTDPETGKIYHMTYAPPESEEVLARLTQRADDTEEKVVVRLQNYHSNLSAILDAYTDITVRVNGSRGKMEVYADVRSHLKTAEKLDVVFVLGGPGCGKGTQCARITSAFGFVHLSAGDLLRAERRSGSPLAVMINDCIAEGKIVPAEVTVGLLRSAMRLRGGRRFLVDGFPRDEGNLECWFDSMGRTTNHLFTLFFEAPDAVLAERILERSKTSGRIDDNTDAIQKRLRTFHDATMPVVRKLALAGGVPRIPALAPPDTVFESVRPLFRGAQILRPPSRTLAVVLPDALAAGSAAAILEHLRAAGFTVVGTAEQTLSKERAAAFLSGRGAEPGGGAAAERMSSGPCLALALERERAVEELRARMIPAAGGAPGSLFALLGGAGARGGLHGSESATSAMRELGFFFPEGLSAERTLAMIKCQAADLCAEDIRSVMLAHGFRIVKSLRQRLAPEQARAFYAEHGGRSFFRALTDFMSSAHSEQLILEREGAVEAWRRLQGPTDSAVARQQSRSSIRAIYGVDATVNATHGSDSLQSAAKEIAFFFPGDARLLPEGSSEAEEDTLRYLSEHVDPVLAALLERILVERPPDVAAFAARVLSEA